jgi:ankyrin repeat protein
VNAVEKWRAQTALMWAAAEGHVAVVAQLVTAGADLKPRSKNGFNAFLFAVREGRIGVVRELLKAGANVNDMLPPRVPRRTGANEFGSQQPGVSALDLAVSNAHFELASMLLDSGADPKHSGPGWTPLHTVTWVRKPGTGSNDPSPPGSGNMSSLEFVRKLVAKGADVNARMTRRTTAGASAMNMIGATPLLMAARTADAELMRLLVKLGADPKLTNTDNSTVLMIAAGLGTRSPGEDAGAEAEVIEAVKAALEFGLDPNAVDTNGETAMHGAAYKHLPQVAKYLAAHGARIDVWNRKNKNGWTPLRIATGVERTANFRTSPPTAAAIKKIMEAAGASTSLDTGTVATR